MSGWREMASRLVAEGDAPPATPEKFGLPDDVEAGLRLLADRRPARITQPEHWRGVVADAVELAQAGWAAKAVALGWSPYDLFGIGPTGSASFDGLAVWLNGRKIVALTENTARVTSGAVFYRDAYLRPSSPRVTPVFLWQFGL